MQPMRQSFFFLVLFIGLSLLEYGCWYDKSCVSQSFDIELVSIASDWSYKYSHSRNLNQYDTFRSEEVCLFLEPIFATIGFKGNTQGFSAYAECAPPRPIYDNRIEKITIHSLPDQADWTDKFIFISDDYVESDRLKLNSEDFITYYNQESIRIWNRGRLNHLYFESSDIAEGSYQLTIQLKDNVGNTFETTTSEIYLRD